MRTNMPGHPSTDDQCAVKNGLLPGDEIVSIKKFADMILDVSILLLESGAHCERINRNVQRIAKSSNYNVEMLMSFTAISVSVTDKDQPRHTITENKSVKHHGVHYGALTGTSLLTWKLADGEIAIDEMERELENIKTTTKYPIWLVRLSIGVACGCLCLLAGGNWLDTLFAFFASGIGLTVKQEMVKRHFNLMISILCSAFATTLIASISVLSEYRFSPESSVATAVLFLIPGVPLINSIIDLLEGYIPIGLARGAFGGFILLCIAVGMFLSMALTGINNF
mgnify:CR=1 FL=1